jgi:hypothetical protein
LLHGVAVTQTKTKDANGLQQKKIFLTTSKKTGRDFAFKSPRLSAHTKKTDILRIRFFCGSLRSRLLKMQNISLCASPQNLSHFNFRQLAICRDFAFAKSPSCF